MSAQRSALKDFETLCKLGSGSFGTVYKVRRLIDNAVYVIKDVRISELSFREQEEAINEVNILAGIDSSYIVGYFDSFIEEGCLHIVMEYCNRGDLQALVKKAKAKDIACLKEDVTWNLGLQVILGLDCLHQQHILHRDLKSANVFLQKDERQKYFSVKIGDLGVAKLLETSTAFAQTIVGTPYYLSPELVKDEPYRDKSDCWALGVLLYECCTLCHPFEARNQCALIMKIIQSPVKPPSAALVSPELRRLILWLLQKNPTKRPNIREILGESFVQNKLKEHGFPLPNGLQDQPVTDILTSSLPLDLVDTGGSMLGDDLNEAKSKASNDNDVTQMATFSRDADSGSKRAAHEDWQSRANRIYEEENAASKSKNRVPSTDVEAAGDDDFKPELSRVKSSPASSTPTHPPKIPRMPVRPANVAAYVRGDRVRGGANAKRVTSTRVLSRHQVQPPKTEVGAAPAAVSHRLDVSKDKERGGEAAAAAAAANVTANVIATVVDASSQSKATKAPMDSTNLGLALKPGEFDAVMKSSIRPSSQATPESASKESAEFAHESDAENYVHYEEDFETPVDIHKRGSDQAHAGVTTSDTKSVSDTEHRDSQDATISQQAPLNRGSGQPVSRINSEYSDIFEEPDSIPQLSRKHTSETKDDVNAAVVVEVLHVNGMGDATPEEALDIGHVSGDSKATPRSNLSSGTTGSVHTLLSNPHSSAGALVALAGAGPPASVAGIAHITSRERRGSHDDALYGYDDDFEDYEDELDNLYEHQSGENSAAEAQYDDNEEDEPEEQALSAEYLAYYGAGGPGSASNAEPKADAEYLRDDFKASLRLSEMKIDPSYVRGAEPDIGHPNHAADNSDLSNDVMSNDSLEEDRDRDPDEARRQIDEMLYWIADTRDILKKTLGEDAFNEIYQLCKENMTDDSGTVAGADAGAQVTTAQAGTNKASYLHEIQRKLQEHLNASLESVLGTVMQVKALLAWEDELARRHNSEQDKSLNFLREF